VTKEERASRALLRLEPADFLEWPQGAVRLGVGICVAVTVVLGLVYFVKAVDRLGDDASRNAAANYDDREFGGGNSIVVDKRGLYEARALIPEDGTYRIVPGPHVEGATELTALYVDQFARYFLMPRRPAPDARWILCYGCDRSELPAGLRVVWDGGQGIMLGSVGR
jgi:hypothetical protein